ncbi:MAG TPA: patatin-like phospholipase family protein [Blastocatellia bacterium]|nr:patatin-like phospholipase family protein [Blastocatellia bacterium]
MRLENDKPLSVVLGAGGVRGFAHVGVLEALAERGFRITEIVGTSAGAIIASLYAAVGLSLPDLRNFGLNMTSRHLLAWAWLRRAPEAVRQRFIHRAGIIPEHVRLISEASGRTLHHGVERLGMVCYDLVRREEIFFHYPGSDFPFEDAARGSAAIPGFFPSRQCVFDGRELRLVDGGVTNVLPVDKLFAPPFAPGQVLVVDISNRRKQRAANLAKVELLRRRHPDIPIEVIAPDTLGKGTVIYRQRDLQELIDAGRRKAEEAFS